MRRRRGPTRAAASRCCRRAEAESLRASVGLRDGARVGGDVEGALGARDARRARGVRANPRRRLIGRAAPTLPSTTPISSSTLSSWRLRGPGSCRARRRCPHRRAPRGGHRSGSRRPRRTPSAIPPSAPITAPQAAGPPRPAVPDTRGARVVVQRDVAVMLLPAAPTASPPWLGSLARRRASDHENASRVPTAMRGRKHARRASAWQSRARSNAGRLRCRVSRRAADECARAARRVSRSAAFELRGAAFDEGHHALARVLALHQGAGLRDELLRRLREALLEAVARRQ